jgi:hypothetical protein
VCAAATAAPEVHAAGLRRAATAQLLVWWRAAAAGLKQPQCMSCANGLHRLYFIALNCMQK